MRTYTSWWWSVWGTVMLLGMLLSVLVWPPSSVVVVFLLAALSAAVATTTYFRQRPDRAIPAPGLGRTSTVTGVAVGATTVGLSAVGSLSGALLLLVLLAAGATSPWAVRVLLRNAPDPRPSPTPPREAHTHPALAPLPDRLVDSAIPSAVQRLTDADLCRAWRVSFGALSEAGTAAARARVVELRQAYLDEIDRRHPTGLATWLSSGARAAGNPSKYLAAREQSTSERLTPPINEEDPRGPDRKDYP